MDKKWFKHFYKFLKHVNLWAFLAVAMVSAVVCVFSLRSNNVKALELRDKVVQVDKDNGDIEKALRELREYMYGHMNTNLASGSNAIKPPIQLKYRYERLVKAEQDKLGAANVQIYNDAQVDCERRYPTGLYGSGRIPCVTEYISTHTSEKPADIPASLYKFDFVSPVWSPDLAGWSLVIASISFALFVVRFGLERWAKAELRDL